MSTLWLKFSDEASLPPSLTAAECERLENVYDAANPNSIWRRAASLLALPVAKDTLLRWHRGVPYINWSLLVQTVSCGWIVAWQSADGGFSYIPCNNLMQLPTLLRSQWRIERYVDKTCKAPLPQNPDDKLIESTALGLALQGILLRLPKQTPQELALWLSAPQKAPLTVRKTVLQIQNIQKRRTQLSAAWGDLFPHKRGRAPEADVPPYFWDEPPLVTAVHDIARVQPATTTATATATEWQGLAVCGGQVTGVAVLVKNSDSSFSALDPSEFPIFVFPRARPETVEVFEHASALLFAEGGALSHACTVAREQGIPCVTALGPEFMATLEDRLSRPGKVWLSMDGATGAVKLVLNT
ncbi:MAG: PEP-utilizing enzyme [Micavibrio sp.]|nr:PEP-utilizing enzyme [Micavibrio sp.]